MYKTYTTQDLWDLMRQVYQSVIHWRWDAAHGYYLNDDGKPNGPVNCHFMAYHVLHHVHQPNEEDVHRATQSLLSSESTRLAVRRDTCMWALC